MNKIKVLGLVLGISVGLGLGLYGRSFLANNHSSETTTGSATTTTAKLREGNTVSVSSNYEKDIKDLIGKNIEKDFQIDSLDIKELSANEDTTFVVFVIKKVNVLYEGLTIIEKKDKVYQLDDIDVTQIDLNSPFTKHILGVGLKDGRNCKLIAGYINNEKIKEIHMDYVDNTTKVIKIGKGEGKTYMNYIIGDTDSIKEIVGFNENNDVVFSYK